jgi:hypothetical protein
MHIRCGEVVQGIPTMLARNTQLLPELCGRADPPELYPGRADVKLGARMLCMPPSVTLSIEPCSFKVTPSIACQIVPHAEAISSGKVIAWYTRSYLFRPYATRSPHSSTHMRRDLLCQVTSGKTSTPNTLRNGLRPCLRYHQAIFAYCLFTTRSGEM